MGIPGVDWGVPFPEGGLKLTIIFEETETHTFEPD
jgi:hypothetical protein